MGHHQLVAYFVSKQKKYAAANRRAASFASLREFGHLRTKAEKQEQQIIIN
jgi:hypothetical protein